MARSQAARVCGAGGAEHQDLGLGGEHARQRGRRRVGRQDAHRVAVGGQGAIAVAGDPQVAPEALAGQRRGDHVVAAVGELDRQASEADRAVVLAGDVHALCGVGRDRRQPELGALLGVVDEVPDLERPFEVLPGLGEGEDLLGLQAGAHVGRQRLGHPVRGAPVVGQLGGGRPVGEAGVLAERLGERKVQRGPLAGQQVAVGRLLQQRVAEGVAVGVLDEDVLGHRGAQAFDQRGLGERRGGGEQPVARPAARRGGHAQHAARVVGQRFQAQVQDVAQARRQRARDRVAKRRAAPRRRRRCPRSARSRRATRPGSAAAPRMPATCSASSACEKAPTSRRSTTSRRSSSARNGRSGWRRCSSSLR